MDEMEELNPEAVVKFKEHNPTLFCRAFLKTSIKCDVITSNLAKTFNNYVMSARVKHLIDMMEDIRGALMNRLYVKRQQMEKLILTICPRIAIKLEKEKSEAANYHTIPSSKDVLK